MTLGLCLHNTVSEMDFCKKETTCSSCASYTPTDRGLQFFEKRLKECDTQEDIVGCDRFIKVHLSELECSEGEIQQRGTHRIKINH